MDPERESYLEKQRQFWNTDDPTELKFNRVETLYGEQRTEALFDALVDERVSWILDSLDLPKEPRIVEIGCGIGAVLQRLLLAIPTAQVHGLDISAAMIAEARRVLGNDLRATLEVTRGDNLAGISDQSVDLVICTGVFIHILDIGVIRNYVTEAFRVLKPGGAFRFNARYWIPERVFERSLGGRAAKWLHRSGLRSSLRPRRIRNDEGLDFSGLHFSLNELDLLVRDAAFRPDRFLIESSHRVTTSGLARVNCVRPA